MVGSSVSRLYGSVLNALVPLGEAGQQPVESLIHDRAALAGMRFQLGAIQTQQQPATQLLIDRMLAIAHRPHFSWRYGHQLEVWQLSRTLLICQFSEETVLPQIRQVKQWKAWRRWPGRTRTAGY